MRFVLVIERPNHHLKEYDDWWPGLEGFVECKAGKNSTKLVITRVSMEVIVTILSKLVYFPYLEDVSNLLIYGLWSIY